MKVNCVVVYSGIIDDVPVLVTDDKPLAVTNQEELTEGHDMTTDGSLLGIRQGYEYQADGNR